MNTAGARLRDSTYRLMARIADRGLAVDRALAHTVGDVTTFNARSVLVGLIILAAGATLLLTRVAVPEVCTFNEAAEALVVQQMVDHGIVAFPKINDTEPSYKPPLFHLTAALLAWVLGVHSASEMTVRLPSIVLALAGMGATMIFTHRWLGAHGAAVAGLVLLGSYQYVGQGRYGRVDMTLTFFETLTLLAFLIWCQRADATPARARVWHWTLAGVAGLSVLAKGPVGVFLPITAVVVTLAIERRWDLVRRLTAVGPTTCFLAIVGFWYGWCLISGEGALLDRQLVSENLARFTGDLGRRPPWYYVKPLLLNSTPLSLLVPFAVVAGLRGRSRAGPAPNPPRSGCDPARLFALFWVLTVVFFTLAAYKRRAYLLPLWPASAMLLAWWLNGLAASRRGRQLRGGVTAVTGILAAVLLVYLPIKEARRCPPGRYRAAAAAIAAHVTPATPLFSTGFADTEALAALLFYLGRSAPPLGNDARSTQGPFYVLTPGTEAPAIPFKGGTCSAVLGTRPGRHDITLRRCTVREGG